MGSGGARVKRPTRHFAFCAFLFMVLSAPTPLRAQAKTPVKVRLATSTAGLDFAPIWIAQRKGYFKEEGIDFEHILTTGGVVTTAAIQNGEGQICSGARY